MLKPGLGKKFERSTAFYTIFRSVVTFALRCSATAYGRRKIDVSIDDLWRQNAHGSADDANSGSLHCILLTKTSIDLNLGNSQFFNEIQTGPVCQRQNHGAADSLGYVCSRFRCWRVMLRSFFAFSRKRIRIGFAILSHSLSLKASCDSIARTICRSESTKEKKTNTTERELN